MKKILGSLLLLTLLTFAAVPAAQASGGYKTTQAFTLTVAAPLAITNTFALPEAVALPRVGKAPLLLTPLLFLV